MLRSHLRAGAVVAAVVSMLLPIDMRSVAARELAPASFAACRIAKVAAHCGTVTVYENRRTRAGRTLAIHVVELDARRRTRHAIFWNPGGPGGSDSDAAAPIASGSFAKELTQLRDRYDVVLVDNRGTGASHQLACRLYAPAHPEAYFAHLFPSGLLRTCRAELAKNTDLGQYTTDISADDLDDVRAAMHYPKIVLDGGSYGTTFFLDYARRYPAHVESIVLQGVAPPGHPLNPIQDARGAQQAMDDLIADCEHDAACNARYPMFATHFAALIRRFDRGPIRVRVRNAVTGREQNVSLSQEVFADQLRHVLYSDESAAYVPYVVERAYRNDDAPLATLVQTAIRAFDGIATGLNLSVTCAEDLPFITPAALARASIGSFQGDSRVRAQQAACRIWNVPSVSSDFTKPVRSDAPALMISGGSDPATPYTYGRDEVRYLANGRQIVVPHESHDSESDCTDALIVRFVRTRDAKHLDASACVGNARRPPFATSMKGFGD